MEVLRFLTCGSVDDGKSTLIGRMLYDSKAVQLDLLEATQESSRRKGGEALDLSLLADGLKAERQQGITIDVAYKYFSTAERKYIIADTPGHVQYTRNMVTGASTAQLAILLVDARKGIVEQTRRHAYISALLGLRHIVLAVNKMDMVDYAKGLYDDIHNAFLELLQSLQVKVEDPFVIPLSALLGDNVVHSSDKMPWYQGPSLLSFLDSVDIGHDENLEALRFPVQGVIRPRSKEFPDHRAYSGTLSSGILRAGDSVQLLQSFSTPAEKQESRVLKILLGEKEIQEAFPPMALSLVLEDDMDISRGDLLIGAKSAKEEAPLSAQDCVADLCWMESAPLQTGNKYILQHNHRQLMANVSEIIHCVDIHTLSPQKGNAKPKQLKLNELGRVRLKSQQSLHFDPYKKNRRTGSFILIDPNSYATVGSGMLLDEAAMKL